jgi:hypothetical protein
LNTLRHAQGVIVLAFASFLILLVISTDAQGTEYHSDMAMSGVIENERIDIWGNLTVPDNSALTLRNVTLVFHCEGGVSYELRVGKGASLHVSDGDGDRSTVNDRSHVSSVGSPWFLSGDDVRFFELTDSEFKGLSDDYVNEPPWSRWSKMVADRILIADAELSDIRGFLFLRGVQGLEVSNSMINGSYHRVEATGLTVLINGSRFNGGEICLYAGSDRSTEVTNCTFESPNGVGLWVQTEASIRDCDFIECLAGIKADMTGSNDPVFIDGCSFLRCNTGIKEDESSVMVVNACSFKGGFRGGILIAGLDYRINNTTFQDLRVVFQVLFYDSFTMNQTRISDCLEGVQLNLDGRKDKFENCTFDNVTGIAINVEVIPRKGLWTEVINSEFKNTSIAINCTYREWEGMEYHSTLIVGGCTFDGFDLGIQTEWNSLKTSNNTFRGNGSLKGSIGIDFDTTGKPMRGQCIIEESLFEGVETAVEVKMDRFVNPDWVVLNTSIEDCRMGFTFLNGTWMTFEGIRINGCDVGISIEGSSSFSIADVFIEDTLMGILILECRDFRVYTVEDGGKNRDLIDERRVANATWRIAENATYQGCNLKMGGIIRVRARLELVNLTLSLVGGGAYQLIDVRDNGALLLEKAHLFGNSSNPFSLKIFEGCSLVARNSTIRRSGNPMMTFEDFGPYARDATIELVNTEFRECLRDLTMDGCVATLRDCELQADSIAIQAIGTELIIAGSTIKSSNTGIHTISSRLEMTDGTIRAGLLGIKALNSELNLSRVFIEGGSEGIWMDGSTGALYDIDVRVTTRMLIAIDSIVGIYESVISSVTPLALVKDGGVVGLYNSSWRGTWNIEGPNSAVEVYWPHYLEAYLNWSGLPLANGQVEVRSHDISQGADNLTLGPDGRSGLSWLMERRKTATGAERPSPYSIVYDSEGLYGEVTAQCTGPWTGILVVDDVYTPTVTIASPEPGSIFNVDTVTIKGSFEEMGSGLASFQIRSNGGEWIDVDSHDGKWSMDFTLGEGVIMVEARVSDIAGNEANSTIWLTVDITIPTLIIEEPTDGTITKNGSIRVKGQVLDVGPSGLEKVTMNEELIDLVDGKYIDIVVPLDDDGSYIIVIAVWDKANNTDFVALVVHRDTTVPDLTLDAQANVTNDPVMTVSGFCEDPNGADITVNEVWIGYIHNIRFAYDVNLTEGPNSVVVVATDIMGNSVTRTIDIVLDTIIMFEVLSPSPNMVLNSTNLTLLILLEDNAEVRVEGYFTWTPPAPNGTLEMVLVIPQGEDLDILLEFRDDLGNLDTSQLDLVWEPDEDDDGGEVDPYWMLVLLVVVLAALLTAFVYLRLSKGDGQ